MALKPRKTRRARDPDVELDEPPRKRLCPGKPERCDPILNLNLDVLNMVFDNLDPRDIFCCQRVSKNWNKFSRDWLASFGRLQWLRPWTPRQNLTETRGCLSYSKLQDLACQMYGLSSGRPHFTLGRELQVGEIVRIKGKYMAWWDTGVLYSTGVITWRLIAPQTQPKLIELVRLLGWNRGAKFEQMSILLNNSGYILLGFLSSRVGYTVMIDPFTMQKLWMRRYGWIDGRRPSEVQLRLGKSLAYCALKRKAGPGYDLAAFCIWSGNLVWRLPLLDDSWRTLPVPEMTREILKQRVELVYDHDGEDLLVVKHTEVRYGICFSIATGVRFVRGRDGHVIYSISFPLENMDRCIFDPITKQGALAWSIEHIYPLVGVEPDCSLMVYRPFSYKDGHFTMSPPVAVCQTVPVVDETIWHRPSEHILDIDPFNMCAVGMRFRRPGRSWTKALGFFALEPLTDDIQGARIRKVVQKLFPEEPDIEHQSFVPSGQFKQIRTNDPSFVEDGYDALPICLDARFIDHARIFTAISMAKTQEEPAPDAGTRVSPRNTHHPFSLGYDISRIIMQHLTHRDIVKLSGINRDYRAFFEELLRSSGFQRQLLPPWLSHIPCADRNELRLPDLKRIVGLRHRLQTGEAVSRVALTHVNAEPMDCQVASGGDFVAFRRFGKLPDEDAWEFESEDEITLSVEEEEEASREPDTLICRQFPHYAREAVTKPVIRLRKSDGMHGSIDRLSMNSNGEVMINVRSERRPWENSRAIVYSIKRQRVMWTSPNQWSFIGETAYVIPLNIGRHYIYCAVSTGKQNMDGGDEYNLAVYNFKKGKKIYETSSLALHSHPDEEPLHICSCDRPDEERWGLRKKYSMSKVVSTRGGDEFLVLSWSRAPEIEEDPRGRWIGDMDVHGFRIVRATDGEVIMSMGEHLIGAKEVLVEPLTNQLIVIWQNACSEEIQTPTNREKYTVTVALPISPNAEARSRLGGAAVFMVPQDSSPAASVVHPFALAAMTLKINPRRELHPRRSRHTLVHAPLHETHNALFKDAALRAMQNIFPTNTPSTSHCYTADTWSECVGTKLPAGMRRGRLQFLGDAHERVLVGDWSRKGATERMCVNFA
ncbi:hypothetical protein BJX64DRAFT_288651 [Aspergillus heterothallicus]